jgi:hypothetical protein
VRFSLEQVAGVRALSEVVVIVCYWIMDIETIRSLGAGSEKTRQPEKDAGDLTDHPLFT